MKSNPLFSVIINSHNGAKYLKHALSSVIKQSYKKWEIIFWDNHSTDNTFKIITEYKNKKIKYFKSNTFLNLYKARNLALKKAKGEYVCFLDSDDIWLKDKLENHVDFFRKNNKFLIQFSNFYIKDEIKKKIYLRYKNKTQLKTSTQNLLSNYSIGILTVCLRRSLFKKYKFNENYNIIGDFDLFIKLSKKYNINYSKKPLAIYRVHNSNYHNSNLDKYIFELQDWLSKNEFTLKKKNYSSIKLRYILFKSKIKLFFRKYWGV